MSYLPDLEVVEVATDELVEYVNNAKLHPSEQIDQIAASIEQFGFNSPILAWHNDDGEPEIVAGHGRLVAARKLGMESLPVVFLDHMDEEQRRAYILVDNQLTMNSGFDDEMLRNELAGILDVDMSIFGFDCDEVEEYGESDVDLWPEYQRDDVFAHELGEANNYVVLEFTTEEQWQRAIEAFGLRRETTRDKHEAVRRHGIGRVIDGEAVLRAVERAH